MRTSFMHFHTGTYYDTFHCTVCHRHTAWRLWFSRSYLHTYHRQKDDGVKYLLYYLLDALHVD